MDHLQVAPWLPSAGSVSSLVQVRVCSFSLAAFQALVWVSPLQVSSQASGLQGGR